MPQQDREADDAVMSETPAAQSAQPSGDLDIPTAGRYRIDPGRSTLTVTTRHLFGLGAVRATLALRGGRITVADPVTRSTVEARAAAGTFRSGNDQRDAAVLSARLLDATTYPSLTFISTALKPETLPEPDTEPGRWLLRGELEVRGVSRPVEARIATIAANPAAGTLRASARLRVDRHAFGITGYRGLAARWLTIDIDIHAEKIQEPDQKQEEA
jgi:polyisoprenoid-binding protein YceI